VGYAYDARALYTFGPYSTMAVHTALLFAILSLAVVCSNPAQGFIAIVISDSPAGIVGRRLLPTMTFALFALGWLSLAGRNAGLYDGNAGLAILVVASMAAATLAIASTVSALSQMDLRRARAEADLVAANAELEARVLARTQELERSLEVAVAERRRAEASENDLTVSEGYLTFALRSHRLGTWLIDLKNQTTHRNLIHGEIFGYSAPLPAWTLERFLDHVAPSDRPGVERTLRAAMVAQSDWTFECRILRADGELRHIRASGIHMRDSSGTATKMQGLVQDITERKRVDDLQQQLTALIESAADAIVTITLEGVVLSWNPAAEHLLGHRAEEMVGQSERRVIPEDRRGEESAILDDLRNGERVAAFETVRRRKDGSTVDVSLTISPICDRAGVLLGASKIMRDITERKRPRSSWRR
jgi:PAS domain S-box-containing protein